MKGYLSGSESPQSYLGGGLLRISSMIASAPVYRSVGLYNPERALTEIDRAINTPATRSDPNSGTDYIENYVVKCLVLRELGRQSESVTLAKDVIRDFCTKKLGIMKPLGLEPETLFARSQLIKLSIS